MHYIIQAQNKNKEIWPPPPPPLQPQKKKRQEEKNQRIFSLWFHALNSGKVNGVFLQMTKSTLIVNCNTGTVASPHQKWICMFLPTRKDVRSYRGKHTRTRSLHYSTQIPFLRGSGILERMALTLCNRICHNYMSAMPSPVANVALLLFS